MTLAARAPPALRNHHHTKEPMTMTTMPPMARTWPFPHWDTAAHEAPERLVRWEIDVGQAPAAASHRWIRRLFARAPGTGSVAGGIVTGRAGGAEVGRPRAFVRLDPLESAPAGSRRAPDGATRKMVVTLSTSQVARRPRSLAKARLPATPWRGPGRTYRYHPWSELTETTALPEQNSARGFSPTLDACWDEDRGARRGGAGGS